MLRVRTRIGPSKIHGTGLFAGEIVPKGKLVWAYEPGFDTAFSESQLEMLAAPGREYIKTYAFRSKQSERYILPADNGRFINHAEEPNLGGGLLVNGEGVSVALRDIEEGEELTEDYRKTDADCLQKIPDRT